jgi:hypothetical protein
MAVSRAYMARALCSAAIARSSGDEPMKINVEVDCTPEEARRFIGLPDFTPVHEKYIQSLMGAMDGAIAPEMIENLMKSWSPMGDAMGFWKKMFETSGK